MDNLKPAPSNERGDSKTSPSPRLPASQTSVQRWEREGSEQIADCRVFRVRRDLSLDPRRGRTHDFYVIEAPDWINVVPLTAGGEVVLIEQYRHGTQELSLEIPGGMVDDGESPAEAAARELIEETGYAARELIFLGKTRPNPAIQNNWIHTFLARGCEYRHEPVCDGTEHTVVRLAPPADIPRLVGEGAITHSLVVTAFHLLALYEKLAAEGRTRR